MFERFTEKAIKVVTYSQEEAIQAKSSSLEPEHLLIGVLREGTSIAARFLRASGLTPESLREQFDVSTTIPQKDSLNMLLFSPAVKNVLKEAWTESKLFGSNFISPDHLFLSLLNQNESIVTLLKNLQIDVERVTSSIIRVIEKKTKTVTHPEAPTTKSYTFVPRYFAAIPALFEEQDSAQLMKTAKEKLINTNFEIIGTEQILMSILENKDSELGEIFEKTGISYDAFVNKLNDLNSRNEEYDQNECLFTPRAFFAINSAYELAKELGSTSIKAEHILLGILKEKRGIAYKILQEMNINAEDLYKKVFTPIEKQKPVILTIIRLAKEETRRLQHSVVGTEQILLGIIGEGTCIGARVLKELGITLKDARLEVEKLLGYSNNYVEGDVDFSPRAKKLIEVAWTLAKQFKQPRIESEHLLLAILQEKQCMAMKVLENLGVDELEITQGILKEIKEKKYNDLKNNDEF